MNALYLKPHQKLDLTRCMSTVTEHLLFCFADGCPLEIGPSYLSSAPDFRVVWPESDIGQTVALGCPCGNLDTPFQATRVCGGNFSDGGVWMEQDVSACQLPEEAIQLCLASEVRQLHLCT